MAAPTCLAIIPAYNEEASIERTIADLRENAAGADILVVNDHSSDATHRIVEELGVQQLYLPCNLGYGNAIQIGCAWAVENGYRRAVFFDGDGQHPARAIEPMVEKLIREEGDIIIASRYLDSDAMGASAGRYWGNQFFSRLASALTGQKITDSTSGMKAVGEKTLPIIATGGFLDMHAEILVYLGRRGFRIAEHPAAFAEREAGVSMYGRLALISYPVMTGTLLLCSLVRAWMDERWEPKE